MVAGASVDIATGIVITFDSGFFAEITSVSWSGISRPSIDVSHMGIAAAGAGDFGNALFLPGDIVDPGELSLELHFNPNDAIPIASAAETITITWPLVGVDVTANTFAGSGFMTDFEITGSLEEKMTATATLKMSGAVTVVNSVTV